jgi:hypothetical protein
MILSGIAGVAAGDASAAAGWWLIVVFAALLLLTFVGGAEEDRSASRPGPRVLGFRPITAGLVILAVVVILPVALLMLAGGA